MTFMKKLNHIYTYYRKPAVITILCILLAVSFLLTVIRGKINNEIFYCAIINNNMEKGEAGYLRNGFSAVYPPGGKEYLTFDFGNALSYEQSSPMESMATIQKLFAKSQAGELDCIISQQEFLDKYGSGMLVDLTQFLPKDMIAAYKDLLVYAPDEHGTPVAYGLDISQSHIIEGAGIYISAPILSVGAGSRHTEAVSEFLHYVLP